MSSMTRAHLLLPPPLPYSPDSIPFKRHQQALSFALASPDPDESWAVYQALHNDLKRHLSDNLYCSLVKHQLEGLQDRHGQDLESFLSSFGSTGTSTTELNHGLARPGSILRLQRIEELLSFARKCQMPFEQFPLDTLLCLVSLDLRPLHLPQHHLASLLMELWRSLAHKLHDDLSSVSSSLRRHWIEMLLPQKAIKWTRPRIADKEKARRHLFRIRLSKEQRRVQKARDKALAREEDIQRTDHLEAAHQAAQFLVTRRGARGLDELIHRVVVTAGGRFFPTIVRSLGHLADLVELDPSVPTNRIVLTLMARLNRVEHKALHPFVPTIDDRIARITAAVPSSADPIRDLWSNLRTRLLSLVQQAELYAGDTTMSKARLTQVGIHCLYYAASSGGHMTRAMDAALALLWTIVWDKRQESGSLTRAIIHHLCRSTNTGFYVPRVKRLVEILIEADTLNCLSPSSFAQLFTLCLRSSHKSLPHLALKLYTWDLKPPRDPKWMDWRRLPPEFFSAFLRFVIAPERRDVLLPSRLYTDYISAGLRPRTDDALALIKLISRMSSPSRNLLLERHIKDYLFLDLGPRENLIAALVEGLLKSQETDDAWLAFRVANRINRGRPLPIELVGHILEVLLSDTSLPNIARCATICKRLADPRSYYLRLMEALSTKTEGTTDFTESRRGLALANNFYTEMLRRHLSPPPAFLSLLVREMAQAGETDLAVTNYEACLEKGIEMDERVAATLIVRLGMKSQFDKADQVELLWVRQSGEETREKSERMRGARAYVDTKRGIEVRDDGLAEWIVAAKGWTEGVGGPMILDRVAGAIASGSDGDDHHEAGQESEEEERKDYRWETITPKVWKAGSMDEQYSPGFAYGDASSGLIFN